MEWQVGTTAALPVHAARAVAGARLTGGARLVALPRLVTLAALAALRALAFARSGLLQVAAAHGHDLHNRHALHLRQLFLLPDLVREATVRAHRENLHAQTDQYVMIGGDRRQFRGSDEGEVTGVEAQQHPLPGVVRQADLFETALVIGRGSEIEGVLPYAHAHVNLL